MIFISLVACVNQIQSNHMERVDEKREKRQITDRSIATPLKEGQEIFHAFLTPFFTSKMKEIASKIRSNAEKRFRVKMNEGRTTLIFWSEFKQISDPSKLKTASSMRDELTIIEVDTLVKKKRRQMLNLETQRSDKIKQRLSRLQNLRNTACENRELERQLKSLTFQNRRNVLLTQYGKYLQQTNERTMILLKNTKKAKEMLQLELAKVKKDLIGIPNFDTQIAIKHAQYEQIRQRLLDYEGRVQSLVNEKLPNQLQMIHCMFLIGMLNEQLYIIILQKKERILMKHQNPDKAVNKSFKIYQKLGRREVTIDCKNSEIVCYKVFIALYMHCKSLTLSNIAHLMNVLSFYSDQFKEIYALKAFEKYANRLVNRLILDHKDLQPMENREDSETLKKMLIIVVKKQHLWLMEWVLGVFCIEANRYYINLSPLKMIIELQTEGERDLGIQGEDKEVVLSEYNELSLVFENLLLDPFQ